MAPSLSYPPGHIYLWRLAMSEGDQHASNREGSSVPEPSFPGVPPVRGSPGGPLWGPFDRSVPEPALPGVPPARGSPGGPLWGPFDQIP
jgi:hypothetical protein